MFSGMKAQRPRSVERPRSIGDVAMADLLGNAGELERAAEQLYYHEVGGQTSEAMAAWAALDEARRRVYAQDAFLLLREAAQRDEAILAPVGPRLNPNSTMLLISG